MKRIECNNCGDCCRGNTLLAVDNALTCLLPQKTVEQMKLKNCPHLQELPDGTTKCYIYNRRPTFCYLFPADPEDIKGMPRCGYKFVEE